MVDVPPHTFLWGGSLEWVQPLSAMRLIGPHTRKQQLVDLRTTRNCWNIPEFTEGPHFSSGPWHSATDLLH